MTKSEKVPAKDRTRVEINRSVGMIESEPTPDGFRQFRPDGIVDEHLRILQRMDGALEGLSAVVRVDLVDDELMVRDITFTPDKAMPLHGVGTAAMRELRFGEIMWIVETVLAEEADRVADWNDPKSASEAREMVLRYLHAARKHKRRPGRRGTPDLLWAEVAAKRVEAEQRWPGNALRKMAAEWPELFSSPEDASDKVYRAKRKGMIDTGRGRPPRLTDKAIAVLGADPTEGATS